MHAVPTRDHHAHYANHTRTATIKRLRREIAREYERMVAAGMRVFDIERDGSLLLPEEVCYLRQQSVLPPPASTDTRCQLLLRKWSEPRHTCPASSMVGRPRDARCTCWPPATSMSSVCTLARSLAERPALYSFVPNATVPPEASHLREVLADGGRLLFVGDSLMDEVSRAARCEARRAGLDEKWLSFSAFLRDPSRWSQSKAALRASFDRMGGRTERLTVAVSLGNHYNNMSAEPTGEAPSLGNVTTSKHSQAHFEVHVRLTLQLLDSLARECQRCNVVFLTAQSQHFETASGSYASSWRQDANAAWNPALRHGRVFIPGNVSAWLPNYTYGCRPLHLPLSPQAANAWRGSTALAEAKQTPNVLTVPLHRISTLWWGAHIGLNSPNGTSAEDRYLVPDCTHYCNSPFLYQPVWWALAKGAAATRSTASSLINK